MEVSLTDEQKTVFNATIELMSEGNGLLVLNAPAGTGKTFLINYIITNLKPRLVEPRSERRFYKIAILAPTNKAVSLIKGAETIHKFFNAKKEITEDGVVLFNLRAPKILPDLIIVDEASMLNRDMIEMLDSLSGTLPILLCGDEAQLPPVGEERSQAFTYSNKLTLTKNMRSEDSYSGHYVVKFRNAVYTKDKVYTDRCDVDKMLSVFKEKQDSGEELPVVLAWTNKRVEELNRNIRGHIFSDKAESQKYYIDEQLLVSGHREGKCEDIECLPELRELFEIYKSSNPNGVRYYTSDTIRISDLRERKYYIPYVKCKHTRDDDDKIKSKVRKCESCGITGHHDDKLRITFYEITDEKGTKWLKPKRELDVDNLNKILKHFRSFCIAMKSSHIWKQYYIMKDLLDSPLDYVYGMTVHKSQGSQWKIVFVDIANIRFCREYSLYSRLAYTAVSRMREMLYFI